MTRVQQIGEAAELFAKKNSILDKESFPYGWGFQEGAKWADENPPRYINQKCAVCNRHVVGGENCQCMIAV
jgi:hypothetical protein